MTPSVFVFLLSFVTGGDLKADARSAAKTTGCTQVSQCQVMEVGSRPCGGPSDFIVYCSKTTDVAKLKKKVKAATEAEKATNATDGLMGTCSVLAKPKAKLEKGACSIEADDPVL
jgi:hypothetical protein